ncbi:hypothetical protein [Candidatus Nitronereus thalassa]|uniref:Uncharacterized protein n=1 Tax=Candidatus Nitronereus thalassa TaxID=3020898 RepID=A0ABU3K8K6_9BACT|nr:hypothetical protein [Candidatus Nitronereus thalassa]MDT7042779.1 hypothetical protein [Candidatus Nitronereus thalassa]
MSQTNPAKPRLAPLEALNRLQRQIEKFNNLLLVEASDEDLKAFDVETESVLADAFGNPSNMFEAYAYAQLGEAGGLINLPEEAQLEGDQDIAQQSLQQRKAVLEQSLAEMQARQRQ